MTFQMKEVDGKIKLSNLPPICKCCGRFSEASFLSGIQEEIFLLILFQSRDPWTIREVPIHNTRIAKIIYPPDRKIHRSTVNLHINGLTKKLADTGWSVVTIGQKGYLPKFTSRDQLTLPRVA